VRHLHLPSFAFASLAIFAVGCTEPGVGTAGQEVIGGTRSAAGSFPSVGALYDEDAQSFFCTGTLISPDTVLTAGHCLAGGGPVPSFTFDRDTRGPVTTVAGASVIVHPMFDLNRNLAEGPSQYYDLAILKLAEPVTDVEPMIVPSVAEAAGLTAGTMLTLVGYGQTVDGNPGSGGVLFQGDAPVIGSSASELQIGTPGAIQNCYGDSGGPAFVDLGSGLRTVGIVSRGATDDAACATGGLDTRVDFYLGWIRQQAADVCVGGEACAGAVVPPTEAPGGENPGPGPGTDPSDPSDDAERAGEITGGCSTGAGGSAGGSAGGAASLAAIALGLALVGRRRRG